MSMVDFSGLALACFAGYNDNVHDNDVLYDGSHGVNVVDDVDDVYDLDDDRIHGVDSVHDVYGVDDSNFTGSCCWCWSSFFWPCGAYQADSLRRPIRGERRSVFVAPLGVYMSLVF